MGRLNNSQHLVALGARHLVGRGKLAHLLLPSPKVSAEHASLYFTGADWKLRDLGSRNGTFVNGQRIPLHTSVRLRSGDELRFGGSSEPPWVLEDCGPPGPAALGPRGEWVVGDFCNLWLPNIEEAVLHIWWTEAGWMAESPTSRGPTLDGARLEVDSEPWTLVLPATVVEPADGQLSTLEAHERSAPQLAFSVSQDEEHVELVAELGSQRVDLGTRVHNAALLVLARRRIEDGARGIAPAECGWVYADDLRNQLRLDRSPLNLQLWRACQLLTKAGLPGNDLIERRDDSGQLRIGFESTVQAQHL